MVLPAIIKLETQIFVPETRNVLFAKHAYDLLAMSYDRSHWSKFWDRNERPFFESFLRSNCSNCKNCLDLGCGTGRYTGLLAKLCKKAIGVDFSNQMLKLARDNYPEASFIEDDIRSLSTVKSFENGKFDAITIARVLSHTESPSAVLNAVCESNLNSGGCILFSDIHPRHTYQYSSFSVRGQRILIETYKHDPEILMRSVNNIEWQYLEFTFENLNWKPGINKFSSIDRTSSLPIFYICVGKKMA